MITKENKMEASIIIAISSSKIIFENFLFHLSAYPKIDDYEIIFINDNIDFNIVKKYIDQYFNINAKIIDCSKKLGYGAANNKAVEYASCDYLIFMNDDIILKPNCLELLISDLKNGKADAVQPKLVYPQNNVIQSTGHVFTKYSNAHALENGSTSTYIANKSDYRTALTTAVCATKKELFLQMGKFDLIFYNAWEGMEYTLKLTINGYKCFYNHKAEAYHIRGGARGLYSLDEEYQSAIFWSRWSSKISSDLPKLILSQLNNMELSNDFLLLNFSKITNINSIMEACKLRIIESISYTYNSGLNSVDFFKCLPIKLCQSELEIIYFANNISQVKSNALWYDLRKKHRDLIIDLSGNVIKL